MSDISTEAVEQFTYSLHSLAQYVHLPDVDKEVYGEAITLIRALAAERDALRAENERLRNPPEEYCAKCGAPKSNHPYRHPFSPHRSKRKNPAR